MRIVIIKQTNKRINTLPILFLITTATCTMESLESFDKENSISFSETRAFDDLLNQTRYGARVPGSSSHAATIEYITEEMIAAGWLVEHQTFEFNEFVLTNIIAKAPSLAEDAPYILLGAHYDSRIKSDSDPRKENHTVPVPGANDGASGVAVLLEIGRILPLDLIGCVRFVFFDAEDNGNIDNWNWIMGSRHFVANLADYPSAVVILDMVGDKDLEIYKEENSDPELTEEIWQTAHSLGFGHFFINSYTYRILDDHIPFLEAGIPTVDIIDFDYPYWHTSQDTPDKTAAQSLRAVGETVAVWLKKACRDLRY